MDGSFSGKSTMHVVLMTWMEAVKFVRIRWFFFFFSSIFFFFLPPFSLRRCRIAFLMIVLSKVEMVVGLNGKWGFEWVIWRYRVLVFRVKYEKKFVEMVFFFSHVVVRATFFFFFYLWIWFIATSNTSLQLVIISISQRCRKFTTFCLIKFVI